jgi:competence protein ComEA
MEPSPSAAAALADQRRAVESAGHARAASRGRSSRAAATPLIAPARPDSLVRHRRDSAPRVKRDSAKKPARAGAKPAAPAGPLDVDRATAAELATLPHIGPALATRIVAERDARGPFGSLDSLISRVKGIGPLTAKTWQPLVTFGGR